MSNLILNGYELTMQLNAKIYIIIITPELFSNSKIINIDNFSNIINEYNYNIIKYDLLENNLILILNCTIINNQTELLVLKLNKINHLPENYHLVKFNYKLIIDSLEFRGLEYYDPFNNYLNEIANRSYSEYKRKMFYENKRNNKLYYRISINIFDLHVELRYVNQIIKSIHIIDNMNEEIIKTHKDTYCQPLLLGNPKSNNINKKFDLIFKSLNSEIEDQNIYHFIEILKLINFGPYNRIYYEYKPNYVILKFNKKTNYKSIFEWSKNLYQHIYTFNQDTFDTDDPNEYILVDLL